MNFQDYLDTFPAVDHLRGLDVLDEQQRTIHHIPAVAGKLGSLKLYHALAERVFGTFDQDAEAVVDRARRQRLQTQPPRIVREQKIDTLLQF